MANIKDVAKEAGVSVTTVSRVMNDRGYISEKTRKRVYDAMEKIGYHPNELAKNFFRLMLCNAYNSKEREKEYINMLQRNKVDGIIIGSHTLEIEDYLKIDMPIVALDRYLGENIPIVSADHIQGGILAANHLINCGCKNVVQFSGTNVLNSSANKRHISFEKVMDDNKVTVHTIEMELNTFSKEQNLHYIDYMFNNYKDIDGVFTTDNMAILVIKECYKRGINIPKDLKIIGYDGTESSELFIPTLTTIKQPIKEICIDVVNKLIKLINNESVRLESNHTVTLIEGETT